MAFINWQDKFLAVTDAVFQLSTKPPNVYPNKFLFWILFFSSMLTEKRWLYRFRLS